MTPIDLFDYTDSKKIPAAVLKPAANVEINSWNILSAYFLDLMAVTTLTFMVTGVIRVSLAIFMVSDLLQKSFGKTDFVTPTVNILPLFFMSYFFFSYFFNHGQTWGMSVMKNRIEMNERNFRSSLLWAMFSSVFLMTGGLSFLFTYKWMQKKNWGEVKGHDHLYFELMQERNFSPINLVDLTNAADTKQAEVVAEETYLKAA
ncbi:MAG: hypothetical protein H0V66_05615 [Bdellovibrionales bacterium]|nr:hypothetical protein [Bdellovibrionales bacterium]